MAYNDSYDYYGPDDQLSDPNGGGGGAPTAPAPSGPAPTTSPAPWNFTTLGGGTPKGGGGNQDPGLSMAPFQVDFGAPPEFKYPDFVAPDPNQILNDPGYQFRLHSGEDALNRSAAAKGVLRTGGTLKDLIEYGQNFGSAEYGNAYNRALQSYDRRYQGVHDAYAPKYGAWQMNAQAKLAAAQQAYQREWLLYALNHQGGGGGGGMPQIPPGPTFIPPYQG